MSLHRAGRPAIVLIVFLFLVGALSLVVTFPVRGAAPRRLFVSSTGAGTACTQASPCGLQTALNQAVNADTILVAGGYYYGTDSAVISLTKSITLCGGWDGASTGAVVRNTKLYSSVINGEKVRRGVYASGGISFTLDGFTIENCNATNVPRPLRGGGIYVYQARPILLNNLILGNLAGAPADPNSWCQGGGIFVDHATGPVLISGNELADNLAAFGGYATGGGIYLSQCSRAVVAHNELHDNLASSGGTGYGGGLGAVQCDDIEINDNWIEDNAGSSEAATGHGRGGGIYLEQSVAGEIERNHITENVGSEAGVGSGGGVAAYWCDLLWVLDNWFDGNTASAAPGKIGEGGALNIITSLDILIGRNEMWSNVANPTGGSGGAIWMDSNVSFRLVNNIIAKNIASEWGGGLALWADASRRITGTLEHNTFVGNNLGEGNGKVAVCVESPYVQLRLINNLFSEHSMAVDVAPGSSAALSGTLFFMNSVANTGGGGTITSVSAISGLDPLLNGSAHLSSGSPAINAGVTSALTNDIDGDHRPTGVGYDIGADEWVPPRWAWVPLLLKRR